MVDQSWPADRPADGVVEQHGVAVPQRRLAAPSCNDTQAAHIEVKAEIVVAIAAVSMCVHMTDTLRGSGQEAQIGKFAKSKIDAARMLRHRVERDPGQSTGMQRLHSSALRPHKQRISKLAHNASCSASSSRRSTRVSTYQRARSPVQSYSHSWIVQAK